METTPVNETNENMKPNISEKTWAEFRATGLFMWINSILHVFGWVLVVESDRETKEVLRVFPARTRFRGYAAEDQEEMHYKITQHLSETLPELLDETKIQSNGNEQK